MTSLLTPAPVQPAGGMVPAVPATIRDDRGSTFLWAGYATLGSIIAVSFFLFPALATPLWTALGLSSVIATVIGVRRHRPRQPVAWYLLAAALLCFTAGDTSYNVLTEVLKQEDPFPSVADLFYLLTYLLFAAGIFLIIRSRSASRDIPSLIDAVIVTTGLGLLSWVYLVVPNFQSEGLDGIQRAVSVSYPLGTVLILAMLARLVAGGGLRIRSMVFLVAGGLALMVADVLYGLGQLNGDWQVGGPVDIGWVVFYITWGAAALHPSMRRLSDIVPVREVGIGRARITLLALASLIAPGVLLVQSERNADVHATTVAIFSAALFVLVLARMSGILAAHQESVRRERVLRTSGEALVAAQGLPDIYRVALASVSSLVGEDTLESASVFLAEPDGVRCVASAGTSHTEGDHEELWEAAQNGGYLSTSAMVSVNPLRYDLQDRGMLITESRAEVSLDQHHALATLASQVALAVESATLGEELRQRHSQEQFAGMIQNASDIIVMLDESGRITYGTPSLERELGHEVSALLGTPFVDLLHSHESVTAGVLISGLSRGFTQPPSVADWRLRHADGRFLFFEVLTSNLLDDPNVAGIVLTMRDVSERRALEQQLMHQAFHDTLTGLPNRALFQDRVEHALARAARHGTSVAMAMVDLDDFKVVNDTRGHEAGDAMLTEVAARLQMTLRSSTTIARLGGDEFAILIEDIDDPSQVGSLAERIMHPFRNAFVVSGEDLMVSASIGVALSGGSELSLSFTELLRCADLALYAAKEGGKARVELYHDGLHTRMVSRLSQTAELSAAMENEQFELHYQPIVLIETGEIVGSEALIRWQHPTRGLVMPADFILLAEDTGQIVELGRWVLNRACAQWRTWADRGQTSHRMSVNVSARQLQEEAFIDEVRAALARHDMIPDALVLELTESVFALEGRTILERLNRIREMGVQIAIDDFGTGYSSLSYLQQFEIHELKVDKSFVDGLGLEDTEGGALAHAIVSMAHSLRLEVVAEGIEETAQREELRAMGCRLGQGYLFSRPVPPEKMLELLERATPLGTAETVPRV